MRAIQDEIRLELKRDKIDELYLNALIGLNKLGEMNLDFFRGSGRVYTREEFLKERPNARLLVTCYEVIRYIGGFYIQCLDSELYYLDLQDNEESDEASTTFMNRSLEEVETVLWKTKAFRTFYKREK